MKLSGFIYFNAILFIGFGLAFALYGPLMMAFFSVVNVLEPSVLEYWQLAAFTRMFGAALFGYGLLLWAIRTSINQLTPEAKRGILSALILANVMGAFVSITQQSAVWQGYAGWIATGIFSFFVLAYGYFLVISTRSTTNEPAR